MSETLEVRQIDSVVDLGMTFVDKWAVGKEKG